MFFRTWHVIFQNVVFAAAQYYNTRPHAAADKGKNLFWLDLIENELDLACILLLLLLFFKMSTHALSKYLANRIQRDFCSNPHAQMRKLYFMTGHCVYVQTCFVRIEAAVLYYTTKWMK